MAKIDDQIKVLQEEKAALELSLSTEFCNPNVLWERGKPTPTYQGLGASICRSHYNSITDKDNQILALEKKKKNTVIGIIVLVVIILGVTFVILKRTNVIK